MQLKRFEFIPQKGIKFIEKEMLLDEKTTLNDIKPLLSLGDFTQKYVCIYPDKQSNLEVFHFKTLGMNLEFEDERLKFIEILSENGLFFNQINLSSSDTLQVKNSLEKAGYRPSKEKEDAYEYDSLNLFLYYSEEGLLSSGFYDKKFLSDNDDLMKNYVFSSKRVEGDKLIYYFVRKESK